jgi:DNA repair exonuclease SbcCD nuclease subunit
LDEVIQKAIDSADILFVAGDIFEMLNPTNRVREEFEKRLIYCNDNELPVVFIPGNHCSPRTEGAIHPFVADRVYKLRNVFLIDGVGTQTITAKNGEAIDILGLPYLYPRDWKKYGKDPGKAVANIIKKAKVGDNASVILGHLSVAGIKNHYTGSNLFSEEFMVPKEIFQADKKFGAVILGHIHQHIWIDDRMWYSGSLFPNDFGEEADRKGYVYFEIDSDNNISNRKQVVLDSYTRFKTVRVSVASDDSNPTNVIIKAIVNASIKNCIVRVIYNVTEKQLLNIDMNKIRDELSDAVHFDIDYKVDINETDRDISNISNIMLPTESVKEYCELKGGEYADVADSLVRLTRDLLDEVTVDKEKKIKSLE